jgi:hypothetical protein
MELGRRIAEIVIGSVFFVAFSIHAQNILFNGNFDDGGGSFIGWNISHTGSSSNYFSPTISSGGVEGSYARFTFEPDGADILSQSVTTISNVMYEINFWAEDGDGHNFGSTFSFGDFTTNLDLSFQIGPGQIVHGWVNFDFTVMATAPETDLSFLVGADLGSEFGIDRITVTPVPEPSAITFAIAGTMGFLLRRFLFGNRMGRVAEKGISGFHQRF